jgi:hypothetical protein
VTIDNFLFTTLQFPKWWWTRDEQGKLLTPSDAELLDPENYKLWVIGWMPRDQYARQATLVRKGQMFGGYRAKADGFAMEHRNLFPFDAYQRRHKAKARV